MAVNQVTANVVSDRASKAMSAKSYVAIAWLVVFAIACAFGAFFTSPHSPALSGLIACGAILVGLTGALWRMTSDKRASRASTEADTRFD